MSKELERIKELIDFYKDCHYAIIPSSDEDIAVMEMWEYTNYQLQKRIPQSLIDDNLCPECKVSMLLLTYNYCPHCGKAVATKLNKHKKQYRYVPTQRLINRLRCDETYNRNGKKVRVKLVGSYILRNNLFDNYYLFYDEGEVYHVEDSNTKKVVMTFSSNSWNRAERIALDKLRGSDEK